MIRFEYYTPHSLSECVEILEKNEQAVPIAGGTDLIPRLKQRENHVGPVVSLRQLHELQRISHNGSLLIGAAIPLSRILDLSGQVRVPAALIDALRCMGSQQIRNVATVGGNLCNAAPSADTAPPLLVLDAAAAIAARSGDRTVPVRALFDSPGRTTLGQGEVLREIAIPVNTATEGSCYLRHTPRSRMDLAVASAAVWVEVKQGVITNARIALGAVAPTPLLASEAASALLGWQPATDGLDRVAALAADACSPIDDIRASADYRRHLVQRLVKRATAVAYERALASPGGTK